jgi:3',5'-cyclic AMP phosphodiesterase CpdA
MASLSRRDLLVSAATVGAGLAAGPFARLQKAQTDAPRALRIVQFTDVHLTTAPDVIARFRETLDQVYAMDDRPDLIVQTGDAIMDAMYASKEDSAAQFDAWREVWADYTEIPLRNCIGNHDVWGWNAGSDDDPDDVAKRGQGWPVMEFGMDDRYETFEAGGWRFITLDSTRQSGGGYVAGCDEEQMNWLVQTIEATPPDQPILISSHIPILNVTGFFEPDRLNEDNWSIPTSWMHRDAMELKNLFWGHPNVKVCLSGHMHQIEAIEFNGVAYFNSGAVSGSWWGGRYYEADPSYAVIDLYEDGGYDCQFVRTPEGERVYAELGRERS